ncbi:MAG: zinc ribbon domain-containing protein [Gammaproteobacteria bacterium]|nr:zinc ribbon domain-containing protein [Gammaproteobacteria bacterium]
MYCVKCGKEVNENDLYCPYCGEKIERISDPIYDSNSNKVETKPLQNEPTIRTISIILFIVTLVLFLILPFIYSMVLENSNIDTLYVGNLLHSWVYIIGIGIGAICLAFGIFFSIKKYKVVKNIVLGAIIVVLSLITFASIKSVQNIVNLNVVEIEATDVSNLKQIVTSFPENFSAKSFYLESEEENDKLLVYTYIKIEDESFKDVVEADSNFKKASVDGVASVLGGDYILYYDIKENEYNTTYAPDEGYLYAIYSVEHNSMAIIILSQPLYLEIN